MLECRFLHLSPRKFTVLMCSLRRAHDLRFSQFEKCCSFAPVRYCAKAYVLVLLRRSRKTQIRFLKLRRRRLETMLEAHFRWTNSRSRVSCDHDLVRHELRVLL